MPVEKECAFDAGDGTKTLPWVSSLGSDFKFDFGAAFTEEQQRTEPTTTGADYNFRHVDEVPPQREAIGGVRHAGWSDRHTYSTYPRGVEQLVGTFGYLDVAPLGRNEDPEYPAGRWRRHDEYETRQEETRQ